jgi:hypothetical protein
MQPVIIRAGKDSAVVIASEGVYELHIDSFTPGTIPMSRLGGYMASFAELLGHSEHVHFARLKPGSLSVAALVDEIAQRKVDKRAKRFATVEDRRPLGKHSGISTISSLKTTR